MRTRSLVLVALALLVAAPALAQRRTVPAWHPVPDAPPALSWFYLVLEGGAAIPAGDLADDFTDTAMGLGAATGYELGARLRFFLSETTAVSPAFHYADFGDWDDVFGGEAEIAYSVRTSVYRYGVDIQQFLVSRRAVVQPFASVGLAVCHNHYEDWAQDAGIYETASNNLGLGVGGGVAMGPVELSAVWTFNETENRNLPRAEGVEDTRYDWSYLVVRAGLALGLW